MKPAPFDYVRPGSLADVCELLADDDDARLIAGGQTLVPMLAMRLARPARLIDILRVPELAGIREENGAVIVGATTRQAQAERDPVIRAQPRHCRRFDRQWRSVGRDPAGCGDARRRNPAREQGRLDVDAG